MLYIFDMGNVVITRIHCLEKIGEHYHLDAETFRKDFLGYEVPLMEGFMETETYWRHIERRFSITVENDPFATFFDPLVNKNVVDTIIRLRQRKERVVCGSNTFAPHWEKLRKAGLLSIFDETYASHLIELAKPEPEFFEFILSQEHFKAQDTYFIDDYPCNIESAKSIGLNTLLYDFTSESCNRALLEL
ncbi:MAG: HAD-IA family hydrolase [Sphaerochaetaceae bacterium]